MKNTTLKILLFLFVLCASILPVKADDSTWETITYVNPIYKNLPLVETNTPGQRTSDGSSTKVTTSISGAVSYVRKQLVARSSSFSVQYSGNTNVFDSSYWEKKGYSNMVYYLINTAMAHTGTPTEGDYLKWHYQQWSVRYGACEGSGTYNWCAYFTMSYLDTASQQAKANSTFSSVMSSLNLSGKSDFEKVKAIYKWITANVSYDNVTHSDDARENLKYTAYAALVKHTAVCQGYATLFYRMCLAAGVDSRVITSYDHAWNIAALGNYYYNLDSTWDEGKSVSQWQYFLKGSKDFASDYHHIREAEYTTSAFNAAYPMASTEHKEVPALTGLKATVSKNTAKLSWSKVSGRKTYVVYRSTSKSSGFKKIGTTTSTSYSDTGLNWNTTYYYKVRAKMPTGEFSSYSSVVKAAIPKAQVTGLETDVSGKTVKLSWNKLSGKKTYYIYRSTSKSSGFTKVGSTTGTSYSDTAPSWNTTYYYKVRAKLTTGDYSKYSSVVKAVVPPQVTGLKATVSGTTAKLKWTKLSNVKTYYIYRSTSKSSGYEKIGSASSASYSAKSLSKGKTYYFKVRAKLTSGVYSGYSSVLKVTVPNTKSAAANAQTAAPVQKLSAAVSGQSVKLSWAKLSGSKSYEVYRSASADSGYKKIGTTTDTAYKADKQGYAKTWYYKVRALLSNGEAGEFSSAVRAVIPAAATPTAIPTAIPTATAEPTAADAADITEVCSEDGSTCTITEKVCTDTECTLTSKVCVVVGNQKACAEPVVTVMPVLTETPAAAEEVPTEAVPTEEAVANPAETTEECSEDGSSCTITEKVCTDTECTITSKVCVVVGDQKACAEPVVTVVPVVTETAAVTEEAPAEEPAATEEAPAEPEVTEEAPAEEPAVTEEAPVEPAVTEEAPAEPVTTEEAPTEEPAVTEEVPAEPAATEETPAEPVATEEAPAEPVATEETPAEPVATEEAPVEEPAVTEEAPAEPVVTEETPAEPVATEEAPVEPVATEEAQAEPVATEEAPAEPAAAAAGPEEPAATEDLTIREISIEDLKEDTITFNAQESFTIEPEKLKVVPEAADWTALSFKLDDESIAAFKSTDIETIKAEGLTLNGLVQGTTTLRIQAGDVEKTVTLVINMSAAEAEALAQAEAAAAAPEEVPAE